MNVTLPGTIGLNKLPDDTSTIPAPLHERYRELHLTLTRAVRRICPRWLAEEAEDLVQEALLKLAQREQREQNVVALNKTYLNKVAYSVVVDEMRRRQRRLEPIDGADDDVEEIPDAITPSADGIIGDAIADCLSRLKADRRRAVTLHLLGHSVPETAHILGFKAKQAENLVYRGIAQLRECLLGKGVYP